RVLSQDARVAQDTLVDLDHLAVHGGVQVADRLDRFDLAETVVHQHVVAGVRQLDVDDVGELLDGELGDANRADIAFQMSPLVRGTVTQRLRIYHQLLPWRSGQAVQRADTTPQRGRR